MWCRLTWTPQLQKVVALSLCKASYYTLQGLQKHTLHQKFLNLLELRATNSSIKAYHSRRAITLATASKSVHYLVKQERSKIHHLPIFFSLSSFHSLFPLLQLFFLPLNLLHPQLCNLTGKKTNCRREEKHYELPQV